ncbi:MAG: ABC transporter substrate-binding protein [Anaerolineae bacterium]|nr:ABC transporter substrate-binding protein [Anaerolineae bacterium]
MRRIFLLSVLVPSVVILLSACILQETEAPAQPIIVIDSLGRTITFPKPPERIVIAGKSNFMLNDAVYTFPQAPDKVVGLTRPRQGTRQFIALLDPAYEDKARFTLESSAEEIATVNPDLVLLKSFMKETLGDTLEQLDIPVVYLDLETPEQYQRDIEVLGQVFNNPNRADEIWKHYQTLLDRLQEVTANRPANTRPSVLMIQYNTSGGEQAFQVPSAMWIQTQMVELAGGVPVWIEAAQGNWSVVNFEQIAAWNPQQIYILSYFDDPSAVVDTLSKDPKWQQLEAVQNNALYGFPKDFYSWDQPDTRWSLGLTWLAIHIQSEIELDLDITKTFYEFYNTLYELDNITIEENILPMVQGIEITVRVEN